MGGGPPRICDPGRAPHALQSVDDRLQGVVDTTADEAEQGDRADRHDGQDERVLDERLTLLALAHRVDVSHDHLEHFVYFTSLEITRSLRAARLQPSSESVLSCLPSAG